MKNNYINIKLVKFTKKFITKDYISWLNNKKINQFSEQRYLNHDYKSCLNFLNQNIANGNLFFAIVDKKKNKHIGNIMAVLDKKNSTCEIRIFIGHQGRGYGLKSFKLLFKKLIKKKVRKIFSGTLMNNFAMIKIYKKMKMKLEWVMKKHYYCDKKYIDGVVYSYFNKRSVLLK